ncbi:hypothetical protein SSAG_05703 [Streptomyces sp. Mg1]|nr:hypothetical protein SSAG_05703 [Streptomyces sp. Mg1]
MTPASTDDSLRSSIGGRAEQRGRPPAPAPAASTPRRVGGVTAAAGAGAVARGGRIERAVRGSAPWPVSDMRAPR